MTQSDAQPPKVEPPKVDEPISVKIKTRKGETWLPLSVGRMPGWAIALATSVVATCLAVTAIFFVYQEQAKHRAEAFKQCIAQVESSRLVIQIFGALRDADAQILKAAKHGNEPSTDFGRIDLMGIQQRVDAYNHLLSLAVQSSAVDCDKLQ